MEKNNALRMKEIERGVMNLQQTEMSLLIKQMNFLAQGAKSVFPLIEDEVYFVLDYSHNVETGVRVAGYEHTGVMFTIIDKAVEENHNEFLPIELLFAMKPKAVYHATVMKGANNYEEEGN